MPKTTIRPTRVLLVTTLITLAAALLLSFIISTPSQAADDNPICSSDIVRQYIGHSSSAYGFVYRAAWNPNSQTFLTVGGYGGEIYLWDLTHTEPIRRFSGNGGQVESLVWNKDGTLFLTTNDSGSTLLWDVQKTKPIRTFDGAMVSAYHAAWSPDGKQYVVGGENDLTLWDVQRPHPIRHFDKTSIMFNIAWNADNKRFITVGQDNGTYLWDKGRVAPIKQFKGQSGDVSALAWNADGQQFLTGDSNGEIFLWDANQIKPVRRFKAGGVASAINDLKWNADGNRFVSVSNDGDVILWAKDQPQPLRRFTQDTVSYIQGVAWGPDGKHFITSGGGAILLWSVDSDRPLWKFTTPIGETITATWSPDGKAMVMTGSIGQVFVWDMTRLDSLMQTLPANADPAQVPACQPISAYTPTPTPDPGTITAVALATQEERATFFINSTATRAVEMLTATAVTFTPSPTASARRVAQVGEQRSQIPLTGGEIWTYNGQAGAVLTIRVNADKPANDADENTRAQQGLLDTYFILRAPDGSTLQEVDDIDPGVVTNSLLENYRLPSDGVYEIEVRGWNNSTGGGYTLVIEVSGSATATPTPK